MEKYFINYGTSAGNETVEVKSLDEAKEIAVEGMQHTETNVIIEDSNGDAVSMSQWIGLEPEEGEEILERFGNSGYYAPWMDY